jgi:hypothetical protein
MPRFMLISFVGTPKVQICVLGNGLFDWLITRVAIQNYTLDIPNIK